MVRVVDKTWNGQNVWNGQNSGTVDKTLERCFWSILTGFQAKIEHFSTIFGLSFVFSLFNQWNSVKLHAKKGGSKTSFCLTTIQAEFELKNNLKSA